MARVGKGKKYPRRPALSARLEFVLDEALKEKIFETAAAEELPVAEFIRGVLREAVGGWAAFTKVVKK